MAPLPCEVVAGEEGLTELQGTGEMVSGFLRRKKEMKESRVGEMEKSIRKEMRIKKKKNVALSMTIETSRYL